MSKLIFNNGFMRKEECLCSKNILSINGNKIECVTISHDGYFGISYYKEGKIFIYDFSNKLIKKVDINDVEYVKVGL